jgi:hypothetical protein
MEASPSTGPIGAIVLAITARYDAAMASGEWPDRPLWSVTPGPPAGEVTAASRPSSGLNPGHDRYNSRSELRRQQ